MRVSEIRVNQIRVNQIRVNQGLGVFNMRNLQEQIEENIPFLNIVRPKVFTI